MKLISLIQSRPSTYKLDGGDKLRYFADLEIPEQRIGKIHGLLDTLTN